MGRSVSIELSQLGANVVIVARNVEKLQAALEAVKVFPGTRPAKIWEGQS
jgi:NAD(P)-dependent dehydrogenase (short-subunit alcohol dehydrogenase family)